MYNYRDLEIFKDSWRLAIEIHAMSMSLPKFELYETGSQIRRSAKSVASMIVEGYGRRRYKSDFVKFLIYAIAECDETIVHLDTLYDTRSLTDKELYFSLKDAYILLSKKINKYTQWVEDKYQWQPSYFTTTPSFNSIFRSAMRASSSLWVTIKSGSWEPRQPGSQVAISRLPHPSTQSSGPPCGQALRCG
jgi:four helix bundle protein